MKKRKLGRTDLQVSELCLCMAEFGWLNAEAAAFALLDEYHRAGGSFIQSLGFCADAATVDLVLTDAETGELDNITTVQDCRLELRHA